MTLLTQRYSYEPINRKNIEGKSLYVTPDGSKVPSVSTILSKTKPQKDRDTLNAWKKKVGEKKAREITTEAANRGTTMHKYLEQYIKTGVLSSRDTNPFSLQSHIMAECLITQGLCNVNEIWGVEVPLYYPGSYAGVTDGCGLHLKDEAIIDYKQANKPKKDEWIADYKLQLVAYALAHNKVHNTKMRKGVVLMCVKPNEIMSGVFDTPIYQEFILTPEEFDYWETEWWSRVEQYYKYV